MKDLLVLRLSALGDVIHTIPAVMAIRNAVPAWRISWAVEAPYRELIEIVTGADAIPVRMKGWVRHPIASRMAAREALSALIVRVSGSQPEHSLGPLVTDSVFVETVQGGIGA